MDYERKYEAKVLGHAIGEAIGEEVKKFCANNSTNDFAKEYRERDEYRYKSLLYFVNISIIISYIAGALAIQLPFIDKFGIMLYDFKLYLLIGAIIFVIIQIAVFISSIYEQFAAAIADVIMKKLENYEMQGLQWIARTIIFIPAAELLLYFGRKWVTNSVNEKYWGILFAILLFIRIYVILSLIFQNKRYSSSMNTTNFVLILIALTVSLYASRASFEEYLLTDAKLINNQNEKSIELLLVDGSTIYYKENNTYKCEILESATVIEYKSGKN